MEEQSSPQSTVQVSAHAPAPSTSSAPPVSFVTSAQFEAMNDKWAEHFARYEALLSRGNVFSTPKMSASVSSHPVLSDKPFINPSARPAGPVVNPAEQDVKLTKAQTKSNKKSLRVKSPKTQLLLLHRHLLQASPVRVMTCRNPFLGRFPLLLHLSGHQGYRSSWSKYILSFSDRSRNFGHRFFSTVCRNT